MTEKQMEMIGKLVPSVMVLGLGALAMYLTAGEAGFGWALLGLLIVWH